MRFSTRVVLDCMPPPQHYKRTRSPSPLTVCQFSLICFIHSFALFFPATQRTLLYAKHLRVSGCSKELLVIHKFQLRYKSGIIKYCFNVRSLPLCNLFSNIFLSYYDRTIAYKSALQIFSRVLSNDSPLLRAYYI
jgi:hypothetical protein